MSTQRKYAPIPAPRLDVEAFARATGMHPDLVTRLVALGLFDVERNSRGQPVFRADQIAAAARLQRLREGLSLNYAALGLVVDLLDRIAALEAALRRGTRQLGGSR
jgi:chaperone modulatory protein CbpM